MAKYTRNRGSACPLVLVALAVGACGGDPEWEHTSDELGHGHAGGIVVIGDETDDHGGHANAVVGRFAMAPIDPDGELSAAPSPDLAFQLNTGPRNAAVAAFECGQLQTRLRASVRATYGDASVVAACTWALGTPTSNKVGIWVDPVATPAAEFRLSGLDLLRPQETAGFYASAALLRREVQGRLARAGNRFGRVGIERWNLDFSGPSTVVLSIAGEYDVPDLIDLFDPDFNLTVTDTLSTAQGRVVCTSSQNLDLSWAGDILDALRMVLSGILEALTGYSIAAPSTAGIVGPACKAVERLPAVIPLPAVAGLGTKLTFNWNRHSISAGGINVAGSYRLALRAPYAEVGVQSESPARDGRPPLGRKRVRLALTIDDMISPTAVWSTSAAIVSSGAWGILIDVDVRNATGGQVLRVPVSVTLTDVDGLTARATGRALVDVPTDDDPPLACTKIPPPPNCGP